MGTWTASDHPRGDGGRFKTKTRTEPEDGLGSEPVSTLTTLESGISEWRTPGGELHRVDGPAIIRPDGYEAWIIHDQYHRLDGPARTLADGTLEWWQHGERHRDDGPAITRTDGSEEWWVHDKLHREDGPAITQPDGKLEWHEHGVRKPPEIEAALTMLWHSRTPSEA